MSKTILMFKDTVWINANFRSIALVLYVLFIIGMSLQVYVYEIFPQYIASFLSLFFWGFVMFIRFIIFSITVIRLRESNWSVWWAASHVIPIIGLFVVIVLFIFPRGKDSKEESTDCPQ